MMSSLSIVIPFLNEEPSIEAVLEEIFEPENWQALNHHFSKVEVIAVDDGSCDGGPQKVKTYPQVKYLAHAKTKGYGSSLKTGFAHATGEYLVFLDMDSSYSPKSISELYVDLKQRQLDMIYGFRLRKDSKMPVVRKFGNRVFALMVQAFFPGAVTDVCTGMRLFKSDLVKDILNIPETGLNFSMSLTMISLQRDWKIGQLEIPYLEREGDSKLNLLTDGIAFFWIILKAKLVRL